MKLDLGPELETFRRELGDWIEDNRVDGLEDVDERAVYLGTLEQSGPAASAYRQWSERLGAARLVCPQWPEDVGGRGLTGAEKISSGSSRASYSGAK